MSALQYEARTPPDDTTSACSCSTTALHSPAGRIIVLRVAGEVDLATHHLLRAALRAGLGQRPVHLLVDLAGLTFCDVRGLALLVDAGTVAAGRRTGYGISSAPRHVDRAWSLLWPEGDLPVRHPTAVAGVRAARSRGAAAGPGERAPTSERPPSWTRAG